MTLERPFLLILIFALIPLYIYWRRSLAHQHLVRGGAIFTLQNALFVLLVVALVGPVVTWKNYAKYVICAVDVSGSIRSSSHFWDFEDPTLFPDASVSRRGDQCVFLPFGQTTGALHDSPEGVANDDVNPNMTNLASAIAAATALAPEGFTPEVILYTDQTYTSGAVPTAASPHAALHIVTRPGVGAESAQESAQGSNAEGTQIKADAETWIERLEAPAAAHEGEVVGMDVFVRSQSAVGELRLELKRNGESIETQTLVFESPGVRGARFQAAVVPKNADGRLDSQVESRAASHVEWEIRIFPPSESNRQVENDAVSAVTQIIPPQRVLLVGRTPALGKKIESVLAKQFIVPEFCTPDQVPTRLEELQKYGLVLLSNIPISLLQTETMESLERYVRDFGGGLIVLGGNQSFTSGGYRSTPIEEILPVVCEEKTDQEREGLALVLVVDRSESMKKGNAIQLAKDAVKRAINVLGPQDQVGILVFADTSGWVVPIRPLSSKNKETAFKNLEPIRAVSVTNMGPAMEKAALALEEVSAQRKHIILMTDGVSNPDEFERIARRIHESGITISTIALGDEAEPNLLADIAKIGNGKSYICTKADDMPQIFTSETASVAKLGVIEGKTPVRQISSIPGFLNFDFTTLPPLLGYVQTLAKPECRVIFESASGDPLLCWRRCGRGVVVAFTSDMESHWIETWSNNWGDFSKFWGRLVSHAMREGNQYDFRIRWEFQNDWLVVYLNTPLGKQLERAPELSFSDGEKITMHPIFPGVFMGKTKVGLGEMRTFCVRAQSDGLPYEWSATAVQSFTDEYRPDRQKDASQTLEALAQQTGGSVNPNMATIFSTEKPDAETPFVLQTLPFWRFFLLLSILVWIAEIGLRRAQLKAHD
ncbi:MAG: VWA domain-containing protein [Planctomycetia bacterium]|nr:VWA domain-containing protein [Planctomycetia bacterium]